MKQQHVALPFKESVIGEVVYFSNICEIGFDIVEEIKKQASGRVGHNGMQ